MLTRLWGLPPMNKVKLLQHEQRSCVTCHQWTKWNCNFWHLICYTNKKRKPWKK
jgi:hypothetical protein